MKNLYDLGYLEIKKLEILVSLVRSLDAILVDVRYSPNSRDPQWRKKSLQENLGENYLHLITLGNRNYKAGLIEIVDLEGGITTLAHLLQSSNVIIMCACRDRSICHRSMIIDAFGLKFHLESIQLTRKIANEIIDATETTRITGNQLPLF